MVIKQFQPKVETDAKTLKCVNKFQSLLQVLRERELKDEVIEIINKNINHLNEITDSTKTLKIQIRKKQYNIITALERKLKIVPKNHYRNLWLPLGMAVFGLPFGMIFGFMLDNLAFLGIGLPIGMSIGIAVGTSLDQKAKKEGRQLDFEVNA